MSGTFLDKVVAETRERIAIKKRETDISVVRHRAEDVRLFTFPNIFRKALERTARNNIIAEIKRASPSKGVINADIDIAEVVRSYESSGAAAISVLTEPNYFQGSLDDLAAVRETVKLPLLRKDFTVDEYQIYEAAAHGADAILFIVAALTEDELTHLLAITNDLGMDAIVEVHTADELAVANNIGAAIIGVNNRDLQSLAVSLDVSRQLIKGRRDNVLMIAESGISTRAEIDELRSLGYNGFLIGETLMRSGDPAAVLEELCA